MKVKKIAITCMSCIMLFVAAVGGGMTAKAAETNTITVNGKGTVKAKPDIAIVYLGVETRDKDSGKAQEEASKIMEAVIQMLKETGVSEENMKTANISIYPRVDYQTNETTGYVANQSIEVKIKDLQNVGKIIDAAVALGANSFGGIQFSIEDTAAYYNEALTLAVKNAKDKADVLAAAIGVSVGRPASLTEQSNVYVMPVYASGAKEAAMDQASAPVEQGMLEITAAVIAVYEY